MCVQDLKSVALPVPHIIGVARKFGSPSIRPRSLFSDFLTPATSSNVRTTNTAENAVVEGGTISLQLEKNQMSRVATNVGLYTSGNAPFNWQCKR